MILVQSIKSFDFAVFGPPKSHFFGVASCVSDQPDFSSVSLQPLSEQGNLKNAEIRERESLAKSQVVRLEKYQFIGYQFNIKLGF
jgi:hypothetical protein